MYLNFVHLSDVERGSGILNTKSTVPDLYFQPLLDYIFRKAILSENAYMFINYNQLTYKHIAELSRTQRKLIKKLDPQTKIIMVRKP